MRMLHVTIETAEFDEEIKFYEDIVGLNIQMDMRTKGRNIVFLANASGGTCIELIENRDATNSGNQYLSVGFKSDDVVTMQDELIEKGYDVSPMISPNENTKFFFVKDPAGVRVQFM